MNICSQWAAFALAGVGLGWNAVGAPAQPVQLKGSEFPLTIRSVGDQVQSRLAVDASGGLLVWQDAAADGKGLGIAALRLTSTLSPDAGGPFQVNEGAEGDQENAAVALLSGKGAFFAWQGGQPGFPRIFGRILGSDGTFLTGDIPISGADGEHQIDPAIARLSNGQLIVTWASYRQVGENYDVFARQYSAAGAPLGPEFRVNQTVGMGRRSPTVAALTDGGFLIAWVAERQLGMRDNRDNLGRTIPGTGAPTFEVSLYGRAYDGAGVALTDEKALSGADGIAAHPSLAPLPNGSLLLAWSRRDPLSRSNSLDVATRVLSPDASISGSPEILNTHRYGDQYLPRLAAGGRGVFAVWSSMGQDGSWEGVYGRWMDAFGKSSGDEIRINTTTAGGQIHPSVASDASGQILTAWSINLPRTGMEIFGQLLATGGELPATGAPFVIPLSSSAVMASWPSVSSLDVSSYRVYAAGGEQLAELTENHWTREGLPPGSAVALQIAYVLATGEVSPRSPVGSGVTWGTDKNFDGLPDDWQTTWWPGIAKFPSGAEDSDSDGVTNLDEWLAGTNPVDAGSRLKVSGILTSLGLRLEWAAVPGLLYQLQSSSDGRSWQNSGGPRFAAGNKDAVNVPATGEASLFRVLRIR